MNLTKNLKAFWNRLNNVNEAPSGNSSGSSKSSGPQITQANVNNFIVKAVGFSNNGENAGEFETPDSDLTEIKNAIAADGYIALAVEKYAQLIFKAGYNIVSDNDDAAQYIRSRLRMMSFTTDTPMDIIFQQIGDDLVAYSNAFLVKSRVETSQLGGIQAKGIYDTNPVGGYFRVDPSTMQIKRDKNGTIKNYQQEVGSNTKKFKPTDVIHFYIDRKGGAAFGTPRITPVLEDVKLLRKLEGTDLAQTYRYANPIIQMKVGLPQAGMQATDKDISDAKSEVEQMNNDGILVTNEGTDFKIIGAEGKAMDIVPSLSYFEKRVFTSLNVSEAMMGRGGAKQDADSMEAQVHDTVKFFQRRIATIIEHKMFDELLLEGGYNPIGNEEDIVHFDFNEINNETKVKMQTHALNLYQGNLITFAEARQACGLDSDDVDASQLYANFVTQPNAIALVQAKLGATSDSSATSASANTGTSGPDKTAPTGSQKTTQNTMQPENKYGKTTATIKEFLESADNGTQKRIEQYQKKFQEVYKKYLAASNDICERQQDSTFVLPLTRNAIAKSLKEDVSIQMGLGVRKAMQDTSHAYMTEKMPTKLLDDLIDKTLIRMFKDIQKRLNKASTTEEKQAAFDAVEYRLRFLSEQVVAKAYWYGYVKACAQFKIDQVYVYFGKSKDREDHDTAVNTHAFTLDDIPAFNAYCSCKVGLNRGR